MQGRERGKCTVASESGVLSCSPSPRHSGLTRNITWAIYSSLPRISRPISSSARASILGKILEVDSKQVEWVHADHGDGAYADTCERMVLER